MRCSGLRKFPNDPLGATSVVRRCGDEGEKPRDRASWFTLSPESGNQITISALHGCLLRPCSKSLTLSCGSCRPLFTGGYGHRWFQSLARCSLQRSASIACFAWSRRPLFPRPPALQHREDRRRRISADDGRAGVSPAELDVTVEANTLRVSGKSQKDEGRRASTATCSAASPVTHSSGASALPIT
jgi:hypothetical protein